MYNLHLYCRNDGAIGRKVGVCFASRVNPATVYIHMQNSRAEALKLSARLRLEGREARECCNVQINVATLASLRWRSGSSKLLASREAENRARETSLEISVHYQRVKSINLTL